MFPLRPNPTPGPRCARLVKGVGLVTAMCVVVLVLASSPVLAQDAAANPTTLRDLAASAGPVPWWQRLMSLVGLFGMVGIAWLGSTRRDLFPKRIVAYGIGLQLVFGVFVLKTPVGMTIFSWLNSAVIKLLTFTDAGAGFVFGAYLTEKFTIALNVLPIIIFFSTLMTVLYHLGVMQRAVSIIAWIMRRTMKTSGSETLSAAANIFVGQTEAPLVVKPYVDTMTRSELHAVMVGGFATVAGSVLAAYVGMLKDFFPDIGGHLIAASVMSAPAALVIAKVLLPETEESDTAGEVRLTVEKVDVNLIDAAARGAKEGLSLALNVGAMLLAFLALLALVNYLIGLPLELLASATGAHYETLTLEKILGWLFWPIAFLMGVPVAECAEVGGLLGEKIILTEFVAYSHLAEALRTGTSGLSPRSTVIATYALCGFANVGSIAIQIGGIGGIAPGRRADLAKLGVRAMIGGTLAACMTATVAGMLI